VGKVAVNGHNNQMAIIYNSDLTKEIREGAKVSLRDVIPNQIADKVVPVMEVNPKLLRRINIVKIGLSSTTGNTTIYTTPTDKDFYLTGVQIGLIKDATNDMAIGNCGLTITPKGSPSTAVIGIPVLTLTAQNSSVTRDFSIPILLEKGSNIIFAQSSAYTVGLCSKEGTIIGYTVDNINA
jgi:hypothetical protein